MSWFANHGGHRCRSAVPVASSMVADTANAGRELRVQRGMTEFCHPEGQPERWEGWGADSASFCSVGDYPGSLFQETYPTPTQKPKVGNKWEIPLPKICCETCDLSAALPSVYVGLVARGRRRGAHPTSTQQRCCPEPDMPCARRLAGHARHQALSLRIVSWTRLDGMDVAAIH